MENIEKDEYIAYLICKEQVTQLATEERNMLREWIRKSEQNQKIYERMIRKDFSRDLENYRAIDTEAALNGYLEKYPFGKKYPDTRRIIRFAAAVAAACLVIILFLTPFIERKSVQPVTEENAALLPGSSKAVLVLSSGKSLNLCRENIRKIQESDEADINNNGNTISYAEGVRKEPEKGTAKEVFNEIRIPKGGEYKLILSDGTKVWLNSQTKIKFPVRFAGEIRRIFIEGEAYFEVAHNPEKPFIITTMEDPVNIKVMGTSFNVRAYADEDNIETVLEKGCVVVDRGNSGKPVILEPGERLEYLRKTDHFRKSTVNTEVFTGWRHGRYIFENEPISEILQRLSRWYGFDVAYTDEEIKYIRFNGNVKRYETFRTMLDAMEASGGVHFEISGNTVYVSKSIKIR